jgi:hypothetical protein
MIANTPRIARAHQLPIRTCAISMLRASSPLAYCDRELRQFRRHVEPPIAPMGAGIRQFGRDRL